MCPWWKNTTLDQINYFLPVQNKWRSLQSRTCPPSKCVEREWHVSWMQNYKDIMLICWGCIAPQWGGRVGGPQSAVPGNICDCVEVTLGGQAGAGNGQPGPPKLHYVEKMYPVARCRTSENQWEKFIWSDRNLISSKPGVLLLPPGFHLQNINEQFEEKKKHRRHTWWYCVSFSMTTVATTTTRTTVTVTSKRLMLTEVLPCTRPEVYMHYLTYSSQQLSEVVITRSYLQFADANPLAQRGKTSCPKAYSLRFILCRKFYFHSLVKLECHPCMPTSRSLLKVFLGSNCLLSSISRLT